jgi:hypothetical protein
MVVALSTVNYRMAYQRVHCPDTPTNPGCVIDEFLKRIAGAPANVSTHHRNGDHLAQRVGTGVGDDTNARPVRVSPSEISCWKQKSLRPPRVACSSICAWELHECFLRNWSSLVLEGVAVSPCNALSIGSFRTVIGAAVVIQQRSRAAISGIAVQESRDALWVRCGSSNRIRRVRMSCAQQFGYVILAP